MPPTTDTNAHLDALTEQLRKQNSLWGALVRGVFYGIGFVVGSAVLAAIVIGILLPIVKDIPGVQQFFSAGVGVIRSGQ